MTSLCPNCGINPNGIPSSDTSMCRPCAVTVASTPKAKTKPKKRARSDGDKRTRRAKGTPSQQQELL